MFKSTGTRQSRFIMFLAISLQLISIASCTAEEPNKTFTADKTKEAIWWKDMHVNATPFKDGDGAVFAIRLVLTNRSSSDVALFKTVTQFDGPFSMLVLKGELVATELSRRPYDFPVDSREQGKKEVVIQIDPGSSQEFCLKLENFLLPEVAIDSRALHLVRVNVEGYALGWKRGSGRVTLYGAEDTKIGSSVPGPHIDFENQKISVHRNRTCTKNKE